MIGRRLRVLALDDDASFLELVREVLTSEGLDVDVETKPVPAVKAAGYDIVIIDVLFARVPVGLALARELLELPSPPKLIVCSADGVLLRQRAAELAGPTVRVLSKPFEIDELLAAIRELTAS
jgi:DNA-binding response OmpR family regulator